MAFYRCAGGTDPTGNAGTGDVLAGKTFSNADGIDKTGTMTNRGAVTQSLNTSTTSYTIPAGYHNGSGKVSITTQEKTVTSSRSAQTVTPDSGKVLSKVTVNALAPTGTYKPTARANNNDMGATGNYRYVDTTAVPNSNSGTYTYAANSTGGTVDMGATNTYRYVNASNVYTKGKADGVNSKKVQSGSFTNSNSTLSGAYWIYNCNLGWQPTRVMIVNHTTGYAIRDAFLDTKQGISWQSDSTVDASSITSNGFQFKVRKDRIGDSFGCYYLAVKD